ncbi:MAG: carboxypeptidase regulatory-like domain-containing protein [Bacteroidetes bacterium]|nr:carboxypeptidase regulatory-like domain-containing protein [Bacteroidota bacterium]MBS1610343.1 carboxypeptidase regulatory-like domain-containing protein [Bacteroidota bacterium]
MKRLLLAGGIALSAVTGLYAFRSVGQGSITGKVTPADQANAVWAVSGKDSVTANVVNGAFSLAVKAGTYKIVVDAKEPYKDALLENITVADGAPTDVGEIKLQK